MSFLDRLLAACALSDPLPLVDWSEPVRTSAHADLVLAHFHNAVRRERPGDYGLVREAFTEGAATARTPLLQDRLLEVFALRACALWQAHVHLDRPVTAADLPLLKFSGGHFQSQTIGWPPRHLAAFLDAQAKGVMNSVSLEQPIANLMLRRGIERNVVARLDDPEAFLNQVQSDEHRARVAQRALGQALPVAGAAPRPRL